MLRVPCVPLLTPLLPPLSCAAILLMNIPACDVRTGIVHVVVLFLHAHKFTSFLRPKPIVTAVQGDVACCVYNACALFTLLLCINRRTFRCPILVREQPIILQGRVLADVTQNCAATLEPFENSVDREFNTVIQASLGRN